MIGVSGGTPKVHNILLMESSQEYSFSFPTTTKKFLMQVRDQKKIHIAAEAGEALLTYFTLLPGSIYWEDNVIGPFTFYFRAFENNVTLEILYWGAND